MKILGKGHGGVVVADSAGAVKKFYLSRAYGQSEEQHLTFLGGLQDQGFSIGCTIPRFLEAVGKGTWEIDGKTYVYCNRMERIPGVSAQLAIPDFNERQIKSLGKDLGNIIFALHAQSKTYTAQWKNTFGQEDKLLAHILKDKAGQVMREGPDKSVNARVKKAASYLQSQCESIASENTLSHLDYSLSNTQASHTGHVNGLVDWGDFGLTHPALSLYQLASRPVWPHVKRQYEQLGGLIREDITYAAAAINLAWVPIICAQLGLPLEPEETQESFEAMYARFEA
ncbi:MAG TPA: phosphotransferase, partial [Candidatus Saccharimonadales bacterium]